ncbi:MAG TPA: response regulator [Azospirillaceae bacterium]|nr:response regulator [Azospirillaceae bacterium]
MTRSLRTILLIEDDPDIREVAAMALESFGGFAVTVCASGREGVARAEAAAPDLVLLDYMMPEQDGAETLAALRALPAMAGVPVVFLTAKVRLEEIEHLKALGAAGVIAKPFDPVELGNQVRDLWERFLARR